MQSDIRSSRCVRHSDRRWSQWSVLLGFSASFDPVDHRILLEWLYRTCIRRNWSRSIVNGSAIVLVRSDGDTVRSSPWRLLGVVRCSVMLCPKGGVGAILGPILFDFCIVDLNSCFHPASRLVVAPVRWRLADLRLVQRVHRVPRGSSFESCVKEAAACMTSDCLQLNANETVFHLVCHAANRINRLRSVQNAAIRLVRLTFGDLATRLTRCIHKDGCSSIYSYILFIARYVVLHRCTCRSSLSSLVWLAAVTFAVPTMPTCSFSWPSTIGSREFFQLLTPQYGTSWNILNTTW